MKKLFVVSDSHNAVGMVDAAVEYIKSNRFDYIVHLGDVRKDAQWIEEDTGREVIGVAGNCDYFSMDPREAVFMVENVRILAVHGDKYGVKSGYDRLSYYAEERACQVALFGHTHLSYVGNVGKALLVNPGTLINGSAAIVTVNGSDVSVEHIKL